jgi:ATP-dependent RNA helicase DeaD
VALAAFTLIHETLQGSAVEEEDHDLSATLAPESRTELKTRAPSKKREVPDGPLTRLFVSLGRKAGITPGDLVGAITGEAGLKGKDIGTISIHEMFSVVEVPAPKANKVIKSLQNAKIRGRKVTVRFDRD